MTDSFSREQIEHIKAIASMPNGFNDGVKANEIILRLITTIDKGVFMCSHCQISGDESCNACAEAVGSTATDITDSLECYVAIYTDNGEVEGVYPSVGCAKRSTAGEESLRIVRMVPAETIVIGA